MMWFSSSSERRPSLLGISEVEVKVERSAGFVVVVGREGGRGRCFIVLESDDREGGALKWEAEGV